MDGRRPRTGAGATPHLRRDVPILLVHPLSLALLLLEGHPREGNQELHVADRAALVLVEALECCDDRVFVCRHVEESVGERVKR